MKKYFFLKKGLFLGAVAQKIEKKNLEHVTSSFTKSSFHLIFQVFSPHL
jgi:hypothetical protein